MLLRTVGPNCYHGRCDISSHTYRRIFVTQTACTVEERTFMPYVLVYLAPTPHYQWHEVIATTNAGYMVKHIW